MIGALTMEMSSILQDSLSPSSLLESLQSLTPRERAELNALLTADVPWEPFEGRPQEIAYNSEATVLGYGGAAGGGKTDLMLGLAHTAHHKSIIFRRELAQLEGIEERARDLFTGHGKFNSTKHKWRMEDGRVIEFGGVETEDDKKKYQGRPHDLKCFDELTHFSEAQFRYLKAWNRTSRDGQRCRVVTGFNPPTDAEGDWVNRYFAPWLDESYPRERPKPGEIRFFAMLDGVDREVKNGLPFWWPLYPVEGVEQELIEPESRTFIPSFVEDNPVYMATGYKKTLQQLPEPLRSLLLKGKFGLTQVDHPWQVIPSAWVIAAQKRWKPLSAQERGALTQVGVDPARGGKDKSTIAKRYSNWLAQLYTRPGKTTPDGVATIRDVVNSLESGENAPLHIDSIGIGASPVDMGVLFGFGVRPMNGSNKSFKHAKNTRLKFANKRAEWAWTLRESLDPNSGEDIALPPDPELKADLLAYRYELKAQGITLEDKEKMKERIHRSPDKGDAVLYAFGRSGTEAVLSGVIAGSTPLTIPGGVAR